MPEYMELLNWDCKLLTWQTTWYAGWNCPSACWWRACRQSTCGCFLYIKVLICCFMAITTGNATDMNNSTENLVGGSRPISIQTEML